MHIQCVAQKWIEQFQHSMYPVNRVSEMIWKKHGKTLESICRTEFNYTTLHDRIDLKIPAKHAKKHLTMILTKSPSGINIVCEFASEVLDPMMIERMTKTFSEMMSKIDSMPVLSNTLNTVEFLVEEELNLQNLFSKQAKTGENDKTAIQLFLENVQERPKNTAIVIKNRKVSYKELADMSENIARQVLNHADLNTLKNHPVVLFMEKDDYSIASLFAVWRLGGHFLPLSIVHLSKVSTVVKSTRTCLVLTNTKTTLKGLELGCKVIDISKYTHEAVENDTFPLEFDKMDLAYIIQTSGSTGTPKTIQICQENLSTLIAAWRQVYHLSNTNLCVLQWALFAFDVFIGDVVRALCCTTGTLVVCPDEKRLQVNYILSLIKENKVTMMEVTPQFGLLLAEYADTDALKTLKLLILGSDILQTEVLKKIKSYLPTSLRIVNSYGMSEATIDSACFDCDQHIPETRGGSVPIGRALPGIYFKVLEPKTLRACPIGTVGELYIGGNVIGSGDTDIIDVSGEKMLKTNDKAYWLPSGDIEIMGRLDATEKPRGLRINTTEIENKILQCSLIIKDVCVTVLKENINGNQMQHLCAFVVKSDEFHWIKHHGEEILNNLRNLVPFYMVPDIVTVIDRIPLSPNGKVQTARLPKLSELLFATSTKRHGDSELSKLFRELFAKCIGVQANLIDDERTFYEQGGHSLLLTKFLALIEENTSISIKASDILSYPSILSLTNFVAGKKVEFCLEFSQHNRSLS